MTSNLNEASNDLNMTACSQRGAVSDADNVGAVHENAIGILIASACVMVEMTGAMNTRAAASGNMTGVGHMKAAAERIVIVFRGILMAAIL